MKGPCWIGIDLGTTNTSLAWLAPEAGVTTPQSWPIPQLIAPATVQAKETLPSAVYVPEERELTPDQRKLPWGSAEVLVGTAARAQGLQSPGRLITSAKSWLSHAAVDRQAEILPWGAPEHVTHYSPVQVQTLLLEHLRSAWNHAFPDCPLEQQHVVVTVPASFDEVARTLTRAALSAAQLDQALLIEEPLAAVYAWLTQQSASDTLQPEQTILVCDTGGGTTDFSVIRVDEDGQHADLQEDEGDGE